MSAKPFVSILASLLLSLAVASPATPTDLEPVVTVTIVEVTPRSEARFGKEFIYECVVDGPVENYEVQWQSSRDGIVWENIDCTDVIYSFILDEENNLLYHRVIVTY